MNSNIMEEPGNPTGDAGFKICTCCRFRWSDRETFLSDPMTRIIGYQVNFKELEAGFFLFDHLACKGTISIGVYAFSDLYDGEVFEERKTGSQECPGFCLREDLLDRCPAKCECAYVREILHIVRIWPKEKIA